MAITANRRHHRLSIRLPEPDLALIEYAAGQHGRSRTDFVREAAVRTAEEVLMASLVRMSDELTSHQHTATPDTPPCG